MTPTIPAARAATGTQRRPADVRLCCIGIENVSSLSKGSRYPRAIHNTPGFNRAEAFIFASRNTPGDRTLASAGLTASAQMNSAAHLQNDYTVQRALNYVS